MDKNVLQQLLKKGYSQYAMAEMLECGQTSVRYWMKKFQLSTPPIPSSQKIKRHSSAEGKIIVSREKPTKERDWDFLQKEHDKGLTWDQINKTYNIPLTAIARARKLGLFKTRNSKQASKKLVEGMTAEERLRLYSHKGNPNRNKGGYRKNAGRSKKFQVLDSFGGEVHLQSSYEKRTADILNDLNIRWIRPKFLRYGSKKYFPDFYLVDYDIYIDPKNNYLIAKDASKIMMASRENGVRIEVISEKKLTKEFFQSLIGKK